MEECGPQEMAGALSSLTVLGELLHKKGCNVEVAACAVESAACQVRVLAPGLWAQALHLLHFDQNLSL